MDFANHTLLLRPNGTEIPIHDIAAPICDPAANMLWFFSCFPHDWARDPIRIRTCGLSGRKRLCIGCRRIVLDSVGLVDRMATNPDSIT